MASQVQDYISSKAGELHTGFLKSGIATPVAVVDIGSNTIRLVIFDGVGRTPLAVFNEKIACGLGQYLHETGRLNPKGVEKAYQNLQRFREIVKSSNCQRVLAFATAAARDALDGPEFIEKVREITGFDVRVLTGYEEGRMAALGVLAGNPFCNGIVGDLGGGSLELVDFTEGQHKDIISLPFGALTLAQSFPKRESRQKHIATFVSKVEWLKGHRTFYAVGGTWRAIGKIALKYFKSPFRVPHGYILDASKAVKLAEYLQTIATEDLVELYDLSKKRAKLVPAAASVLRSVLEHHDFERIVFSYNGAREGVYFDNLPEEAQKLDPLLAACGRWAVHHGRFNAEHAAKLFEWTSPLFKDETFKHARLRHAACLISDISWGDHPEFQTEQGFNRCMKFPFNVTTHKEKLYLAITVARRYGNPSKFLKSYSSYLPEKDIKDALKVGRSLRLCYTLTAGIPELLNDMQLSVENNSLVLTVNAKSVMLLGEAVEKRLAKVARAFDLDPLYREV